MFHQLPLEVVFDIAKFLNNSELLRCSETCRDWNKLIRSKVMIRVLRPESAKAFNSAMIAAYRGHINGSQVVSLETKCKTSECHYSVQTIPRIFPAIKTFKFGNFSMLDDYGIPQLRNIYSYKKWQSCLEVLHLAGDPLEFGILFKKCRFQCLTELSLACEGYRLGERNIDSIIKYLKHIPNLKHLTLTGGCFQFSNLEQLPPLQTLQIQFATICRDSRDLPNDISLADKTTGLSLMFRLEHQTFGYVHLFQYIIHKYKSLRYLDLQISSDTPAMVAMSFDNNDAALLASIPQFPSTLEAFRNKLTFTKKSVINALDNAVTSGHLPHLTTFLFWAPVSSLRRLSTLRYLYSKNMFRNIKSLFVEMKDVNQIFEHIPPTSNLTKLHFTYEGDSNQSLDEEYYLDSLLEAHPLLEELSVNASCITLNVRDSYEKQNHRVQELSLNVETLSSRIIPFIRKTMPGLKKLSIKADQRIMKYITKLQDITNVEQKEYFTQPLFLPDHTLESMELCSVASFASSVISHVKSAIGERYYSYDAKKHKVTHCDANLIGIKLDEAENCYYFQIECKSLLSLKLNGISMF